MPTYDYECPNGHRFEVFQRMTEEPVADCLECGAPAKRMISGGAGFLFKGEGFYITDYRSEDYKKKASAEGAQGKDGTDKAASKESKSEPKAEGGGPSGTKDTKSASSDA